MYNTREIDAGQHYFDTYGVIQFNSDIISQYENSNLSINDEDRKFTLKLKHSPEECMYPHCEVLVLENGEIIDINKPKSIKTSIRSFLMDRIDILTTDCHRMK